MHPYIIIILFFVLTVVFVWLSIAQEHKLIKTFENNDLLLDDENLTSEEGFVGEFDLTLLNLGFLPSYRGEYQSFLFKNKFLLKCYNRFNILTLNTLTSSYNIKLPKSAISVKNEVLTGKLLKINVNGQNLLFKLPNEMQNVIYKRFK